MKSSSNNFKKLIIQETKEEHNDKSSYSASSISGESDDNRPKINLHDIGVSKMKSEQTNDNHS